MSDEIRIQYKFTRTTPYGEFVDAMYFDPSEFESKKQDELDAIISERVDAYVSAVEKPTPPPEYTKEELEKILSQAEQEKIDQASIYDAKIAELSAEIATKNRGKV
jgi:Cdc6-like AAA superfamily ATPase